MLLLRFFIFLIALGLLYYMGKRIIGEIRGFLEKFTSPKPSGAREIKEPETKTEETGGSLKLEFSLPKINSERDIHIRKLGESLELRAVKEDLLYFKVVPVGEKSKIAKKEFKRGRLKLVLR